MRLLLSCSVVSNSETPWTVVARQAPLSMGFSLQEYWSGLPFPPPGDLPNPGMELASPKSPAFFTAELPGKPRYGACMRVQSLQSCLTLCDPMDHGPPGSSVHGIFQARVLEWVAISFSTGMGRELEICISNSFQARLMLAGPRTMLGESLL